MVSCWYMADADNSNQREPLQLDPPQPVTLDQLAKNTGVLYWKLDADDYEKEGKLGSIREERGYSYSDIIEVSKEKLPNYEEKLKMFFQEHLHTDEEIRFFLSGSGYFDIRDNTDRWVRIELAKGDMIVLPAGIYHRFTLDNNNYAKVMRLFVGEPVWTAHNRPSDDMEARKQYVKQLQEGFSVGA